MSEDSKKESTAKKTPPAKKQEVVLKSSDLVKVANISKQNVPTSKGIIEAGKKGECTLAESRSYNKYLKVI